VRPVPSSITRLELIIHLLPRFLSLVSRHISAFAKALAAPDLSAESSHITSPTTETGPILGGLDGTEGGVGGGGGEENEPVEKLRAVSDFAPIHTRVKRSVLYTFG